MKDALSVDYPTVEINGTTYTIRPFGWKDLSKFMNIFKKVAGQYQRNVQIYGAFSSADMDRIAAEVVTAMPLVAEELFEWIADLLTYQVKGKWVSLEAEKFEDPYFNDISTMPDIFAALSEHPGLEVFLKKWGETLKGPAMGNYREMFKGLSSTFSPTSDSSSDSSTSSVTDMD